MRHARYFTILCLTVVGIAAAQRPVSAQKHPLQIAASLADMSRPFFQGEAQQLQAEADKLGDIKLDIFDAKNQTSQQQTDLLTIADKKYDGLILSAVNSSSVVGAAQAVIDANIPVVTLTRSVKGIEDVAYIGSNDSSGAEQQAQLIIKQFPNGARIFNIQ